MKILHERRQFFPLVLGIFFLNYFFDRITKSMAIKYLREEMPINIFDNLIILVYAENTGAFLSLGENWNIYIKYTVLLIIPIIICIIALIYLMVNEIKLYRIIILSCIIGGGIGNLVDRLFNNFTVIDFMNFGIGKIRTGVLNAADLSVTFGVIILLIFEIIINDQRIKTTKKG
jgi:signal peptidase II